MKEEDFQGFSPVFLAEAAVFWSDVFIGLGGMVRSILFQVAEIRPGAEGLIISGLRLCGASLGACVLSERAKMMAASDILAKLMSFWSPSYRIRSSHADLSSRPVLMSIG